MSRYTYPHTIDNGQGERLTFLRRVPGVDGERVEIESVVEPGSGPPTHAHLLQEESLTVRQGRMGYRLSGQDARYAEPGESVLIGPGELHQFWNAGDDTLVVGGYFAPPGNIEYILGEFYALMHTAGSSRPDIFDAAFLMRRYRDEYTMIEVPAPVQRFVFPVLVVVGRLLGKYRKYADAPEPVRR